MYLRDNYCTWISTAFFNTLSKSANSLADSDRGNEPRTDTIVLREVHRTPSMGEGQHQRFTRNVVGQAQVVESFVHSGESLIVSNTVPCGNVKAQRHMMAPTALSTMMVTSRGQRGVPRLGALVRNSPVFVRRGASGSTCVVPHDLNGQ